MYTAYFDASGEKSKRWLVVFGFVAEAKQWKQFENEWSRRLSKDGLSYLHMRELPTQKIVGSHRQELISGLTDIITKHVLYRFGCGVEFGIYDFSKKNTDIEKLIGHAYALCARDSVNQAYKWRREFQPDKELKIIFDDGDDGKQYLVEALSEIGKDKNFGFESSKPDKKIAESRGTMPLQSADLAAWHWRRNVEMGRDDPHFVQHAKAIIQISKIPGRCSTYRNTGEIKILADLGMKARFASLFSPSDRIVSGEPTI